MSKQEVIMIGGGLAGLSCAMRLAEQGVHVKIISVTQVKRSHSVCAQGGINAAVNIKGEDDSPMIHAYDTIKGGDFLSHQPPIVEMCLTAPLIIQMMDRFGCTFNRTPEGNIDFRRFGGTLYKRTAFCSASTGQQLLYALDEQVRRREVEGLIEKYPDELAQPTIVAGLNALGRNSELARVDAHISGSVAILGDRALRVINEVEYMNRRATALGVNRTALFRTEDELAEIDQRAAEAAAAQAAVPAVINQANQSGQ